MDQAPDSGQLAAAAAQTLHSVAGLSPGAQVAAVIGLTFAVCLWIWTRRPQPTGLGDDTLKAVISSMADQAAATNRVAERVEQVLEQNASIMARLPGSLPAV